MTLRLSAGETEWRGLGGAGTGHAFAPPGACPGTASTCPRAGASVVQPRSATKASPGGSVVRARVVLLFGGVTPTAARRRAAGLVNESYLAAGKS